MSDSSPASDHAPDAPAASRIASPPAERPRARHAWWAELAIVVVLYAGYDAVRGLIRADAPEAVRHGQALLRLEHLLAIDVEHPINNTLEHSVPVAVVACLFYASAHFLVTPAVLVWTWLRRPRTYGGARAVLAGVTVLALLGFWLFPTAPPRLLPGSGFHDTLSDYRQWGWWGAADSAPRPMAGLANQFAAFPSLHAAWAMWCGVSLWRQARRWSVRVAGALYPVVTMLVVLGTANHYVLDVAAGVGLFWVCDRSMRTVFPWLRSRLPRRRRGATPVPDGLGESS